MLVYNALSKSGKPLLKNTEYKRIHDDRGKTNMLAYSVAFKYALSDPLE